MTKRTEENLGGRVRRGAAWSAGNVALSRVLQFGTTMIVARLVAEEDFGALAVALSVQMIALSASELGATAALARGDRDPDEIAPTVYTIALVNSALLAGGMAAAAPWLAATMGAPEATSVVEVMSLTVLLAGVSSVPSAMIWRDFHQDRRMLADIANIVVTTGLVIPLALAGWGAMALAWSRVGGALAATVILVAVAGRLYRPGFDLSVARQIVGLGAPLALANVVVFATLNLDNLVVGRQLGAVELGIYMLAFTLASLPSNVVTQLVRTLAVPAFGRLHASGELPQVVPRAVALVAVAAFPMGALLAGLAGPLMVTLYGDAYAGGAVALVGLGVFAAGRTLAELLADLSLAVGRTGALLWVQVVWLATLAPALWLAVDRWGIAGAGVAHAVVVWAVVIPVYLAVVRRPAGLRLTALLLGVLPAGVAAALGGAVAWWVAAAVGPPLLALVAGGAAGGGVFVVLAGRSLLRAVRDVRGLTPTPDEAGEAPPAGSGLADDTTPIPVPILPGGVQPIRIPPELLRRPARPPAGDAGPDPVAGPLGSASTTVGPVSGWHGSGRLGDASDADPRTGLGAARGSDQVPQQATQPYADDVTVRRLVRDRPRPTSIPPIRHLRRRHRQVMLDPRDGVDPVGAADTGDADDLSGTRGAADTADPGFPQRRAAT